MKTTIPPLRIALGFVLAKFLLHLCTANNLGFHRDEFLYLALGRHLDWGFWSNPPAIGLLGWLAQNIGDGSLLATRFLPALAGAGLIWVTALMVKEMGGKAFAQVVSGIGMMVSIAWLRTFSMLQPVPFDILCWAVLSWLLLKWLNTKDLRWWYYIGLAAGTGMLIKYSILFWAAGLAGALLLSSERKVLLQKAPWLALGIGLLVLLPNIIWQGQHGFPVLGHMQDLSATQLQRVNPVNFLTDQLLMQGAAFFIWLPGLFFLFRPAYRLLAWHYVLVLLLLLLLHGKSYYTLGVYPVLFAAGAVYWEKTLQRWWTRSLFCLAVLLLSLPLLPVGLPLAKPARLVAYFHWLTYDAGLEGPVRWEQGNLEALPQDFADMLGWKELAILADTAVARCGGPDHCLVYAENYGQAGAVEHFNGIKVVSFSDSYLLWAPDTIPADIQQFVYINDELGEDVRMLFDSIEKVGVVQDTLARERGAAAYRCWMPKQNFPAFWAKRVQEIRAR